MQAASTARRQPCAACAGPGPRSRALPQVRPATRAGLPARFEPQVPGLTQMSFRVKTGSFVIFSDADSTTLLPAPAPDNPSGVNALASRRRQRGPGSPQARTSRMRLHGIPGSAILSRRRPRIPLLRLTHRP